MSKGKNKYTPKPFESKGYHENGKGDTSANIYSTMLRSIAFQELTPKQQMLYVYMKEQYYHVPQKNHPKGNNEYFYFNQHIWLDELKLYTNKGQFYKDMKKLVECGFIEVVERSPNTRERNVYKYSDKWQHYDGK